MTQKEFFSKLTEVTKSIHEGNKKRGFYDNPETTAGIIALIHSELSEALEADRENNHCNLDDSELKKLESMVTQEPLRFKEEFEMDVKNSFEDELADAVIRIFDLAAYQEIDLGKHICLKLLYNETRPYKHGKKY